MHVFKYCFSTNLVRFVLGVCVIVSLGPCRIAAQPSQAAAGLEQGNRFYVQGNYQDAFRAYGSALSTGYASGALYYNLGNTYFRLGQIGQAIRFYEKARLLSPRDERIRHNLEVARRRVRDQLPVLPEPYWVRWWRHVTALDPLAIFGAGLLFYFLAGALLIRRILTGRAPGWQRRVLVAAGGVGLTLLGVAFAASYAQAHSRRAVVVVPETAVREAPDFGSDIEATVPEGVDVRILDRGTDWIEVRLPDGTTGWVEAHTAAGI